MYGGNHYVTSATALVESGVAGSGTVANSATAYATPQGMAIKETAIKFGDGKTLPILPCKRFYNPYGVDKNSGKRFRMYACRLHHEKRLRRVLKEGGKWRGGEKPLDYFWSDNDEGIDSHDERRNKKVERGGDGCEKVFAKSKIKKEGVSRNSHHPISRKSCVLEGKASAYNYQSDRENFFDGENGTIKPECKDRHNDDSIELVSNSCKIVKKELEP
ncbi:hypothetical protein ACHAXS_010916 [Conticribra weissflogii]